MYGWIVSISWSLIFEGQRDVHRHVHRYTCNCSEIQESFSQWYNIFQMYIYCIIARTFINNHYLLSLINTPQRMWNVTTTSDNKTKKFLWNQTWHGCYFVSLALMFMQSVRKKISRVNFVDDECGFCHH